MDETEEKKGFKLDLKLIIIIAVVIVAIIIGFIFVNRNSKYKSLETSMLATAKDSVRNGRIVFKDQYYFTIAQMGITETYDCNKDSGVNIRKVNGVIEYDIYLICDSYKSGIINSTSGKYIELVGANPMIVENNTIFVDPGYVANGYQVVKTSNYKNSPGLYTVSYNVYSNGSLMETVTRYVIVSNVASADAPVITLNGDENTIVRLGSGYAEAGYIAIDAKDGNITGKVITDRSDLDTSKIGEYVITYKVTNSLGLTATKKRLVSVVSQNSSIFAQASLSPDVPTKGDVVISLKIMGNTYSYATLPDGKLYSGEVLEYTAHNNDTYTFTIYGTNNEVVEKKVTINNIDRVAPTGKCKAVSQGGTVTYTVTEASDANGIKGYSYYLGNGYSDYKTSKTFKYVMDYQGAKVIIQDLAGNTTTVACSTSVKSTITSVSIPASKTIYVGDQYVIPVTIKPSDADEREIYFNISSGNNYVSLNDGVVTGLKPGTATIKLKVTHNSKIEETIKITVKEKSSGGSGGGTSGGGTTSGGKTTSGGGSGGWTTSGGGGTTTTSGNPPSGNNKCSKTNDVCYFQYGDIECWCGNIAGQLGASLNGQSIPNDYTVTVNVGQTIRIKMYLPKGCGNIEFLTRTSASGTTWDEWITQFSEPSVKSGVSSTYVATQTYDWVIIGKKSTNGRAIQISQTSTQKTSRCSEIKSFFDLKVIVK